MKYDVITIGSATRDVFMSTPDFKLMTSDEFVTGQGLCVPLGSKLDIKKIVFATGGGASNAAVTFARQGLKTACIAVVGTHDHAEAVIDDLNSEGVDTSFFQKHDNDFTAYSVVLVQEGGERTILYYKGEGQHFATADVNFDQLDSSWFYLGNIGANTDLLSKALVWAAAHNVKIATDPGTLELELGLEKLKPLLSQAAIVHLNKQEASRLTGVDYQDEEGIFKKMDELVNGIFIMSKGNEGVVVSDGQNIYNAGVPDSPVVERTGAGDAFTSGFVCEYARSGDIVKAIQFGTANASSVVTQYGAKAGILKKGDNGQWPLVEVSKQ